MVHESTTLEEMLRALAFRELLVDVTPVEVPRCARRGATTWMRLLEQERG